MSFDCGRNACRAAEEPWWIVLCAAAGKQRSRCEVDWWQRRLQGCQAVWETPAVGSCRHGNEQAWLMQATGGGRVLQPCQR